VTRFRSANAVVGQFIKKARIAGMSSYDKVGRFYDAAMGDRRETAAHVRRLVRQHKPKARTLLELACGTGGILQILARSYNVTGLDVSSQMLSIARKKLPGVKFFKRNMLTFALGRKFDVIICMFDSMNHVLKFAGWKKIFRNAARHLEDDGLFLFDINTETKLKGLIDEPTRVHKFGRNLEFINVTGRRQGIVNWNLRIFQYQRRNSYRVFEENIKETSFPVNKIRAALRKQFSHVKVMDLSERRPLAQSERLYFVCKR
jgi:SAM-dependent methyltransferase